MSPYHVRRWDAMSLAVLCWGIACAFSIEKVLRDGVHSWTLLFAMPILTVAAGILLHEAWYRLWHRWNLAGGVLFGALALAAMAVTLPVSIGSSATSTDLNLAQMQKSNEDHARLLADLAKANKAVTQAEGWVAKTCKPATITAPDCLESKTDLAERQATQRELTGRLVDEKPATGTASGDKRIAWVLNLFGVQATEADVANGWPILPPLIAEILSAVFYGLSKSPRKPDGPGFVRLWLRLVRRRRQQRRGLRVIPQQMTQAALAAPLDEDDPPLPAPPGGDDTKTKQEALADLLTLMALGHPVPSQDWLKDRWGLGSKGTVSKWLSEWEEAGLVSRPVNGRCKTVEAA